MARIEFSGISKSFGATSVLKDIDADIADGEFLVILGPSGCGKSTLLRLLAGLEEVSAGTILIDGRDVTTLPPKDRGCGMVFQNYALYPHMTVRGNIGYGLMIARVPKAERARRIEETAALLELTPLLDRRPAQLSGGQRQRVAIGRALAREPKVFLFDEPLSNLDAKLRTSTRVELRRLHDRLGATSVFVTHDQVEAMTLADRIVILKDGGVEQIGTPKEIYDRPATRFVASFIGSPQANLLDGLVEIEGDSGAFVLNDGHSIPLGDGASAAPRPGPAVLGIRPEDIDIGADGLEALVDATEELGSHRLLHCRVGEATIVVADSSGANRPIGAALHLRPRAKKMHFFDATSGRALRNGT